MKCFLKIFNIIDHKIIHINIFSPAPPQQMEVMVAPPVRATLAGLAELPCRFSVGSLQSIEEPLRIKWTKLEEDGEKLVVVSHGGQTRRGPGYEGRVKLPEAPLLLKDGSLLMSELRASDAGTYRCELMLDMDNAQSTVRLNVTGELLLCLCEKKADSLVTTVVTLFTF